MKILLDTNALLWWAEAPEKMRANVYALIASGQNTVSVSIVSYWEISIKVSIRKLVIASDVATLQSRAAEDAIDTLPISMLALNRVATLPFHHKDPFDRLIAATALTIGAALVSADALFDTYGVTRLWD